MISCSSASPTGASTAWPRWWPRAPRNGRRAPRGIGFGFKFTDAGCCGLAGSFSFAWDRYEVSQAIGEHVPLPKVRGAGEETLLVTERFSLPRTDPLDPAQVLQIGPRRTGGSD